MPTGFSYNSGSITGMPPGATYDDGDATKLVFTVPTDAVNGTGSFTATFDVTNDFASDGTSTFNVEAKAVEKLKKRQPSVSFAKRAKAVH